MQLYGMHLYSGICGIIKWQNDCTVNIIPLIVKSYIDSATGIQRDANVTGVHHKHFGIVSNVESQRYCGD